MKNRDRRQMLTTLLAEEVRVIGARIELCQRYLSELSEDVKSQPEIPVRIPRNLSPAARRRIAVAQRKRWAEYRIANAMAATATA